MKPIERREAIACLGLGAAGLLVGRRGLADTTAPQPPGPPDLTALATELRRAPRQGALAVAARAIREGATLEDLLGAVFLAGIHDVRPRHVGGKLHCVMMVESAFQVAAGADEREGWLSALWNLEDFKRSQARDRREGDWVLPPRPPVKAAEESAARREFDAAMAAWDSDRADRAIVGLLPHHDRHSLFEILWPLAARSFASLGHKIIFAAHVERVLGRIGWQHAEPAVRSLIHGLLHVDSDGRQTDSFDDALELARTLPEGWLVSREAPDESMSLVAPLRTATPREAQQLVVDVVRGGLGARSTWDGLRLFASELCLRGPTLLPVHGVTEVNAFGHAFRSARSEPTQLLLLLQAAGWLVSLRDGLIARGRVSMKGPGIDELRPNTDAPPRTIDDVLAERAIGEAARLAWAEESNAAAIERRLRLALPRKAVQSHQYKYLAAVMEERQHAHRKWTSRLLAPALGYLPNGFERDAEVHERSLHALRAAGVLPAAGSPSRRSR